MEAETEERTENTQKTVETPHLDALSKNIGKLTEQGLRLAQAYQEYLDKSKDSPTSIAQPMAAAEAFSAYWSYFMAHPKEWVESSLNWYNEYLKILNETNRKAAGEKAETLYEADAKDRRFKSDAWNANPVFDFIKQTYIMTSKWVAESVDKIDDKLPPDLSRRLNFYAKQYVDALSPSNFILTNPEVMQETVRTNGENLVKGMENLVEDLKASKGMLDIKMTDHSAFEVGKNLAVTKGKVVFRNSLLELIQYSPTTETVNKTPLLIISPWINKYYILDLKQENSFVKWLTDQGHTVFITSWVNAGPELANIRFEDYMTMGALAAIDTVLEITSEKQLNVIGYCIGGTLMAATLSYLAFKKEQDVIKSITFLTTMVDFAEPGDLGVFIHEDSLTELESNIEKHGTFDGHNMGAIFKMLRSNDLIWSFAVNNYLLGKDPFPFDILFWNNDNTDMPATMHLEYLDNCYLRNKMISPGQWVLAGAPVDLRMVTQPCYILSTVEDHIAPWKSTYAATQHYKSEKIRFVLSASGHVAGVVNPANKGKYGHWTAGDLKSGQYPANPEDWFKTAKQVNKSWWIDWNDWIVSEGYAGGKVPARKEGSARNKPICEAPGTYIYKMS